MQRWLNPEASAESVSVPCMGCAMGCAIVPGGGLRHLGRLYRQRQCYGSRGH